MNVEADLTESLTIFHGGKMDKKLFNQVIELTGLPTSFVEPRLEALLAAKGISSDELTVEELRLVLVDFLQDVILEAKDAATQMDFIS
tara:strand:- start:29 stop:292 length:264 start_codon:yes stop_codon:yes gene_type:complete